MSRPTFLEQLQANVEPGPFYREAAQTPPAPANPQVKLIAFYLPQFHPIPENDAWWGRGFTEWTNVTKALPRFAGHVQPRLPADLGFYDLRNPQVLQQQAKLARSYGIGGFCFHHYWFNGRRLLDTPLELLLADPTIDIPFCINWANENWTRRWDGLDNDILLGQHYSPEDDAAFSRSLLRLVRDPRYIRIDGRPLVMIYRPGLLPGPLATMRRWRVEFARAGEANPYIVMAQAFRDEDPRLFGVDAAAEFPPHNTFDMSPINARTTIFDSDYAGHILDYAEAARQISARPTPPYKLFRAVSPCWDNEARKPGRGLALAHSTPAEYGLWLEAACRHAMREAAHKDERIVFINAWNEWAEGAMLEPDRHFGHAYLAETARVLHELRRPQRTPSTRDGRVRLALISHDAHLHGAQMIALALARVLAAMPRVQLTVLIGGPGELTPQFAAAAPTETIPGDFADLNAWREAARRLVAAGMTAVICNTLVSARAIGPLREAGLRIVQLVHELPSLIRQYKLEAASRDAAAHAAAIVFPSGFVREQFESVAGPISGRAVVRHQGLHIKHLSAIEREQRRAATRKAWGVSDQARVVLGVGFGDSRKGLDLWPRLIRRVLARCETAVFVWIGRVEPGLLNWLRHDVQVYGLEGRLILPGPTDDPASAYTAADAFVLTSREDPFPSVVVEAMASGLPTVVFEGSGGIVELVVQSGGVSVPYLDADAMGDAVGKLLADPVAAAAMGAKLAASVAQDFRYEDYAAGLIKLAAPEAAFVSVIVPNYNYARYLKQRMESIWAQTVQVDEIILLDDASSDKSAAVIAELAAESPVPVRVVLNPANSGSVSSQWAKGVALAQGTLVWIAEADDFADSGFLAAVLPAFDDPEVVFSYTESRMVDEAGRVLAPDYLSYVSDIDEARWKADFQASGRDAIAEAFSIKNTLPNVSAAVFQRDKLMAVLERHLPEMHEYRNTADWLCYIRLLEMGGTFAFTARPLNNHRRHTSSVTIAAADRRHLREIVEMQELAAEVAPVPPDLRAKAVSYRHVIAKQFDIELESVGDA